MHTYRPAVFLTPRTVLFRLALLLTALAAFAPLQVVAAQSATFEGVVEVLWGDPSAASREQAQHRIQVRTDSGQVIAIDDAGPSANAIAALSGNRVEVVVEEAQGQRTVRFLRVIPTEQGDALLGGAVTGSQPWVSILCKFSDIASEPEDLAYFEGMYANTPGGLDHYWREQSYGQIDVVGSEAFAWVDLPNPQSTYIATPGSGTDANLGALFNDCTQAVNPLVDFGNGGNAFVGINMMFNGLLDCCAWGGSRFATLDGISKNWRTTWNPPWSFADEGVIAHEMGHGFGLPHSNNFDGDDNPYDSRWDVMSSATRNAVNHPTYGRLGKHTLSYHKDRLAWIAPGELFEPTANGTYTITIDQLALPSTPNYRMARLNPPTGNVYYTVEVRDLVGDYDGNLPGNAVIIVEVDPSRSQPAWVVDADVPPANTNFNEGSMWRVGEVFSDPGADISIEVLSATANGFQVRIMYGSALPDALFDNGFE